MTNEQPIREPDNSTTNEWMGQKADADAEKVDRALEESGGDEDEAMEELEGDASS